MAIIHVLKNVYCISRHEYSESVNDPFKQRSRKKDYDEYVLKVSIMELYYWSLAAL